ncbi:hypothetical protein EBR96_08960, partial [bacterium]|nr:hypothetical protein [bacterium]
TIFSGIHPANRPRAISIALLDANVLSENREFLFRIPRFTESNTNQLLQVFNTVLNRTGQLPFPAWRIVERALIDPSVPDDVFRNAMELTANHVESVSSATWNQVNLALFSPDSTDQGIRRFAMVREFPEIFRRLVPVSSFGRHTADLD